MPEILEKESSSFRDPSGFIFRVNNEIYRQVNYSYKDDYDLLMNSGLYDKLTEKGFLIKHIEIDKKVEDDNCYKTIKPEMIDFISYPYEWSFSMYKDAALLTLKIQKIALKYDMSLKDATAYNIQFKNGRPVFIDTLSFEKNDNMPWVAYKQFCQHFLAPLLLMAYRDIRLQSLMKNYIDGIPLDLTTSLLPKRCLLNPAIFMHINLHSKLQSGYESSGKVKIHSITKKQKSAIIEELIDFVKSINWQPKNTEWGDYYSFTNYSDEAMTDKGKIIEKYIEKISPVTCWDLGANNGYFTRIAANKGVKSVAFDLDPVAVEKNYLRIKQEKEKNILALVMDLTNPSSSIGWNFSERMSLKKRGKVNLVLALALIHHLAISNNLPFSEIARFFAGICDNLILEFVPKNDSKVQILLSTRKDIFLLYNQEYFEKEFGRYFNIVDKQQVKNSERIIYLLSK